jgi:hypothetical protein
MMMTHKQYTTSCRKKERLKTLTAIFCLLAVIIAGTVGLILENQPMEPDVVYPMTNRNITWTGAGYSGIYGGR